MGIIKERGDLAFMMARKGLLRDRQSLIVKETLHGVVWEGQLSWARSKNLTSPKS
jgi:hypothetical protein